MVLINNTISEKCRNNINVIFNINKQQQVNNYQQVIQKKLQEEDKKSTQIVINDINDFVKAYGKKHNYSIIFGASGSGNIMYAGKGADLTEIVLEGILIKIFTNSLVPLLNKKIIMLKIEIPYLLFLL